MTHISISRGVSLHLRFNPIFNKYCDVIIINSNDKPPKTSLGSAYVIFLF